MKLREALDKLNKVKGLTHAEQGECGSAEEESRDAFLCRCNLYVFKYPYHCFLLIMNSDRVDTCTKHLL